MIIKMTSIITILRINVRISLKFCELCAKEACPGAGLAWINALHQFEKKDEKTPDGKFTALTYLLENDCDDWRTMDLLMQNGADANFTDGMGESPFFKAIKHSARYKTSSGLLYAGANGVAYHKGKSLALWAKESSENEQNLRMIFEATKQKFDLDDDDFVDESDSDSDSDY